MIVLGGAHQLVEQCAIHVVLNLDLVEGGDLLFELRISLIDALDDGRERPGGKGEGEDAYDHHEHAEQDDDHAHDGHRGAHPDFGRNALRRGTRGSTCGTNKTPSQTHQPTRRSGQSLRQARCFLPQLR